MNGHIKMSRQINVFMPNNGSNRDQGEETEFLRHRNRGSCDGGRENTIYLVW